MNSYNTDSNYMQPTSKGNFLSKHRVTELVIPKYFKYRSLLNNRFFQ